jgi:hypothetical protein
MIIAGKKDLVVPERHSKGLWGLSRRRGLNTERQKRSSLVCGGKQELDEDIVYRVGSQAESERKSGRGSEHDLHNDVYLCIANGTHGMLLN